ncbi:hypothetical protein PoB_004643600 [Plakobranchus ocellatus]|uniref:Peptidase A1 domain-containing protein n=1 Tax=Plakobranchus ocellatus TaxID=259542 RepID=A0AAV4B997_9GAST|nr:hypothetical protein PoB_004643600 [Plakobranchus ocellatus]
MLSYIIIERTSCSSADCANTMGNSRNLGAFLFRNSYVIDFDKSLGMFTIIIETSTQKASPQQGDLRLSGPPSGQGTGGGARTRDRRGPADLRTDSLATVPPTPPYWFSLLNRFLIHHRIFS